MNCRWIDDQPPDPKGVRMVRCARCDNYAITADPVERIVARCQSADQRQDCRHLGAETGQVACATCRGNVRIKVFACDVYGRCTRQKKLDGCACCDGCAEFITSQPLAVP